MVSHGIQKEKLDSLHTTNKPSIQLISCL